VNEVQHQEGNIEETTKVDDKVNLDEIHDDEDEDDDDDEEEVDDNETGESEIT